MEYMTDTLRDDTFTLIKSLTGQSNTFSIPVQFIKYTGSFEAALFLSQLLWWSDKGSREDGFIFKTYAEWEEETTLSEYQVRKITRLLKNDYEVLETKLLKANGVPTLHYRLDPVKFSDSFLEFLKNGNLKNYRMDTEKSEGSINIDNNIDNKQVNTSVDEVPEVITPAEDVPDDRQVFDDWVAVTERAPRTVFDDKRKKLARDRLKEGFTVEDLRLATRGCVLSEWHMGKNDRNTVFDDFGLIFRDAKHVEDFRAIALQKGVNANETIRKSSYLRTRKATVVGDFTTEVI